MHYINSLSIGVIPLGTGNDMARFLGWGAGYRGKLLEPIIQSIRRAEFRMLDRWAIDVEPIATSGAASLQVNLNNIGIQRISIIFRFRSLFLITI